jgi:hypothetical protein
MKPWDYLRDLITDKTGKLHEHPDFKKTWSSHMILRWLSMDSRFMNVAAQANKFQYLISAEAMYLYLVKAVPHSRRSYIQYIKRKKDPKKVKKVGS